MLLVRIPLTFVSIVQSLYSPSMHDELSSITAAPRCLDLNIPSNSFRWDNTPRVPESVPYSTLLLPFGKSRSPIILGLLNVLFDIKSFLYFSFIQALFSLLNIPSPLTLKLKGDS